MPAPGDSVCHLEGAGVAAAQASHGRRVVFRRDFFGKKIQRRYVTGCSCPDCDAIQKIPARYIQTVSHDVLPIWAILVEVVYVSVRGEFKRGASKTSVNKLYVRHDVATGNATG
jgi:hypothetical protein